MADIQQAVSVAAVVVILALAPAAAWLVQLVWKAHLMRCPETGGVALVEMATFSLYRRTRLGVQRCDLWPEKKRCAQGCLALYAHTAAAQTISLEPLKRFPQS